MLDVTPCPAWCQGPAGHDVDELLELRTRMHLHRVAQVPCAVETPRAVAVGVYVVQAEVIEDDGRVERMPPAVWLADVVDVADDLSGDEATELAGALLVAAGEVARLTGRPTPTGATSNGG